MTKRASSASGSRRGGVAPGRDRRVDAVMNTLPSDVLINHLTGWSDRPPAADDPFQQVDLVFAAPGQLNQPGRMFDRLRFGGRFICVAESKADITELAKAYDATEVTGFRIEQSPTSVPAGGPFWRFWRRDRAWYFTARKMHLVRPNEYSSRFTYDVNLAPSEDAPDGYVVRKTIPSRKRVLKNLMHKFPNVDISELERRVDKLCGEVFPVFLTREARFLQQLQTDLPREFRTRVPRVVNITKDSRGFVTEMDMSWLRMGTETMSQLEFAIQAAELLHVLHEHAELMHLDLRLDNVLISRDGVSFVDFGSAAREGEDLSRNPLLRSLFQEIMQTSQIQRVLKRMAETGEVTSQSFLAVRGQADKKVDTFFLAVQMAKPVNNPDIAQLVDFDPRSREAKYIEQLTARVLRPPSDSRKRYDTAEDLLFGLQKIRQHLQNTPAEEQAHRETVAA